MLSRVAGLFARRGFNIVSLAVSPTEDERFSRMTIVVDAESAPLEQITKQLNKLIPVIKITELAPDEAVERELMLVTVKATAELAVADHRAGVDLRGQDRRRRLRRADDPGRGRAREARRDDRPAAAVRHRRAPAHRPHRPAQARPPARPSSVPSRTAPSDRLIRRRIRHRRTDTRRHLMPATIYYDDDADLGAARGPQGRGPRLRLAGPRARAEPEGLRRRRARRPARGLVVVGEGRGGRACACSPPREACKEADVIMVLLPDTEQARSTRTTSSRTSTTATRSRSRTASTSTSARSRRRRASTCG